MQGPAAPSALPRYDVTVAGGGVTGLAMALAIRCGCRPRPRVALFDPTLGTAREPSLRAVAVTAASVRLLDRLGLWSALQPLAHPMTSIVLSDAPADAALRPAYLTLSGEVEEGEPFAHMVLHDRLRDLMLQTCRSEGVTLEAAAIGGMVVGGDVLALEVDGEPSATTRLLVAADGSRSRLRERAGIPALSRAYGQSAVTATLRHPYDHGGRATQHFMPGGPLALLPLRASDGTGRRTSIVWSRESSEAERLAGLPAALFADELQRRIGYDLGEIALEDRPMLHPLHIMVARRLIAPRLALAGDAARTIHPLAGQGLNLGFADVEALAEAVTAAFELGLDPGASAVLDRYQRARRGGQWVMAATTDLLNHLFRLDAASVRAFRDLGLSLVDRSPELQRFFLWQAAGLSSSEGRSSRGR